ncbi:MAG: UDP-N-acetylmuramate--L-alanine ligase [Saprospiraceae bacterium]|nr:UDP-N-acetylmuramate--L-alanine ligase [Saprospiraceae bacterium]
MNLQDLHKVYFIGIGGIGMSAIARYFLSRGVAVYGYDRTETNLTQALVAEGAAIHYTDDPAFIPEGIDLVIYTPAIPASHSELVFFQKNEYPIKKRAEVLGIISRGMKTAAIAGTHGKTTTSSITAHLLRTGGIDCTAFLGGIVKNFQSNFLIGKSDWVVVEADEYDRSFLHLSPDIAVILSMDADHLDIYGDSQTLLDTGFMAFARQVKPGGRLWVQNGLMPQFTGFDNVSGFGIDQGQRQARNVGVEDGYFVFDYVGEGITIERLRLPMPGRHNVENATAAITVALHTGVDVSAIREGLATFGGVKRRFEFIYRDEHTVYIDDYAHHPTEIKAVVQAARQLLPGRKLTGVFQPHLFSRTRDFAAGFAEALDGFDDILLLDIYPARELPIPGVTSEIVFNQMKNPHKQLLDKGSLMKALSQRRLDVLMTIGAGDIDTFISPIEAMLASTKGVHNTTVG